MKKTLALLLTAVMLMMSFAPVMALAANDGGFSSNKITMYVVTENKLWVNVRAFESLQADVLTTVPYGGTVTLLSYNGTWSYVQVNNVTGYVMSRYLSTIRPEPEKSTPTTISYQSFRKVTPYTAVVKASRPGGYVNLRWAPDKSVAVAAKEYDGSYVTVLCEGSGWYQVMDANGYVGFMMSSFLMFMK